jgi:hypothetical protein
LWKKALQAGHNDAKNVLLGEVLQELNIGDTYIH